MLNQQGQQKLVNMLNDTFYIYIFFQCGNIKIIHLLYSYSFADWRINKTKTFLKLVKLTGVTILFTDKLKTDSDPSNKLKSSGCSKKYGRG